MQRGSCAPGRRKPRAGMEDPISGAEGLTLERSGDVTVPALHLSCRGSRRKLRSRAGDRRGSRHFPLMTRSPDSPGPPPQGLTPSSAMNDDVLDRWIEAFRGPLVGLVASWSNDWREAEEVAQDALAEAWVGRDRFEGDPEDLGAAGAWLRGIAFRLHAARRRGRARLRLVGGRKEDGPLDLAVLPADGEDPRMEALRSAFGELSSEHQSVLRMRYLEPTSNREVAALLGRTEKAVEHLLRRARKELHRLAERRLDPDGGGRER